MIFFRSQWFGGSGDKSMAEAYELHRMLDQALQDLSGIQQPPRPGTDDDFDGYEKRYQDVNANVAIIAKSIYTALTDRVVEKDKKAKKCQKLNR